MSRFNVKVPVADILPKLIAKRDAQVKLAADYKAQVAAHKVALDKWKERAATAVRKSTLGEVRVLKEYVAKGEHIDKSVTLTVDLSALSCGPSPKEPQLPEGAMLSEDFRNLENAIKALSMTSQTHVSASVYASILDYL